jgi:hypothetical protein
MLQLVKALGMTESIGGERVKAWNPILLERGYPLCPYCPY